MTRLAIPLLLALALAPVRPAPAAPNLDVPENSLRLYFDAEGWQDCQWTGSFQPVTMYVILQRPTFSELHRWEAAVWSLDTPPALIETTIGHGGVNGASYPDFAVSFAEPVATSDLMVLATVRVQPLTVYTCLVLTGISTPALPENYPLVWPAAAAPLVITNNHRAPNGVTASIGDCSPIPEDQPFCNFLTPSATVSWGRLKASFR